MMSDIVCTGCKYLRSIPGDCHIQCLGNANPERLTWHGCGVFPLCFDACTIKSCDAKEEEGQGDAISQKWKQ